MENETKHTAGPWKFNDGYVRAEDGTPVADVRLDNPKEEEDANAALIAAAPELLEAAKKALDCIKGFDTAFADGDGDKLEEVRLLEAAIAKAEGKS